MDAWPSSDAPAAARPRAATARDRPRCGSCGRPAGRCPSTASCASARGMLDACLDPATRGRDHPAAGAPARRRRGIFFSDIVVPLRLAGVDVEIVPGRGPVFAQPVRTARRRRPRSPRSTRPSLDAHAPIAEAVALAVAELGDTPLIGFAGAPFTLAAYLVEGGPSKDHLRARALMHADPESWNRLAGWLRRGLAPLPRRRRCDAGASAGSSSTRGRARSRRADYRAFVAPHSQAALAPSRLGVPAHPLRRRHRPAPRRHAPATPTASASTPSASTGACRSTRPPPSSAPTSRCRATSTPRCSQAPWEVLEAHVRDVARARARGARARPQPRPRRAARDRPRRAHPHRRAVRPRGARMTDVRDLAAAAARTVVVVVGGGIAGLVAARDCAKVGIRVTLRRGIRSPRRRAPRRHESAASRSTPAPRASPPAAARCAHSLDELGLADRIVTPTRGGAWLLGSARTAQAAPLPGGGLLGIPDESVRRRRPSRDRLGRRLARVPRPAAPAAHDRAPSAASARSCARAWARRCSTASSRPSRRASTPRVPTTSTSTSPLPA